MDEIVLYPIVAKYFLGVLGSAGVEMAALLRAVIANSGNVPAPYNSRTYIIVRILFAFIAVGPLAALLADSLVMAFYVGISAPLLFDRAAAGIQTFDRAATGHGSDNKNGDDLHHN